jgi:hypothetical protein
MRRPSCSFDPWKPDRKIRTVFSERKAGAIVDGDREGIEHMMSSEQSVKSEISHALAPSRENAHARTNRLPVAILCQTACG